MSRTRQQANDCMCLDIGKLMRAPHLGSVIHVAIGCYLSNRCSARSLAVTLVGGLRMYLIEVQSDCSTYQIHKRWCNQVVVLLPSLFVLSFVARVRTRSRMRYR